MLINLNTSHVNVNPDGRYLELQQSKNLNTSHVNVNQLMQQVKQ